VVLGSFTPQRFVISSKLKASRFVIAVVSVTNCCLASAGRGGDGSPRYFTSEHYRTSRPANGACTARGARFGLLARRNQGDRRNLLRSGTQTWVFTPSGRRPSFLPDRDFASDDHPLDAAPSPFPGRGDMHVCLQQSRLRGGRRRSDRSRPFSRLGAVNFVGSARLWSFLLAA
jgi:hypothetical protein